RGELAVVFHGTLIRDTRRLALFVGARGLRPALMRQGHYQLCLHALRAEGALRFTTELTLDYHADQAGTEPDAAPALRYRPAALVPIKFEAQTLFGSVDAPGELQPSRIGRETAVLAGIRRKLMHRG